MAAEQPDGGWDRRGRSTTSLRGKLLLGYGSTLLVSVLLVLGSIASLLWLGRASGAILSENYRSIAAADGMMAALARQERALGRIEPDEPAFRGAETLFLLALGRARDNITIRGEEAIVDDIQTRYAHYLTLAPIVAPIVAPQVPTDRTAASAAAESVLEACGRLREINERTMYRASDAAVQVARMAVWAMAGTGTGLVCLGLILALALSRRAVLPLRQLLGATVAVGSGDYRVRVPVTTQDEIGALAGEFNGMVAQLESYHGRSVQLLQSEQQKSAAILRSLEDGVVVLDPANVVLALNPAASRLFGVGQGEAIGRHLLEVHRDENLLEIAKRVPTERARPAEETVVALGSGERASYCMVSVTPIDAPGGGDPGKVLLLRDVTALKEVDRLKSEFISTASHELRGPLTSVAMSVTLLRESVSEHLGPKERQLLGAAEEELGRLRALVNDLLDLSRLESGRLTLAQVAMSPTAIVERAVELLQGQAVHAGIRLETELPATLPDVRVDAARITWVLTNLLGNAIRYAGHGGSVVVAATVAGRHVHVSVRDTGPGIPPEDQGRVFERFVRVGPAGDTGGTGLGLAICQEIVRAHGGTIWVESAPGKGSTFTFTLPSVAQGGTS